MYEVPNYGLRAYALFYTKHGVRETFQQSELDWIVSQSMRKKIFATLLRAGWITKVSWQEYACVNPDMIFKNLLDFRVPAVMREAQKPYAFTGLSAIEIWSDFSYVQRGRERSPYFVKVLIQDVPYWNEFFNQHTISHYVREGSTIGEFVIVIPVKKIRSVKKNELAVEPLEQAMSAAKKNEMFPYAYTYMKKKYGDAECMI